MLNGPEDSWVTVKYAVNSLRPLIIVQCMTSSSKESTKANKMYVCKKCHDRDIRVTKCMTPFNYHSNHIKSKCDICGNLDMVAECWVYNCLKTREIIRCLSVKSATQETAK